MTIAATADVDPTDIVVHDAHDPDPSTAFALSRLTAADYLHTSPIGIFRQVERPTYDDQARAQLDTADGAGDLQALIDGGDAWTVDD